jgi:DNA-binding NarL/FixJ family response regulator
MNTKIMIIDAHPVYVLKTVGFLESLTFKNVEVVSRGAQADLITFQYRPDIVILSATLPDANSVQLAKRIKSQLSKTAIIVQAGLLIKEEEVDAFKAVGVAHVLPRREKDWSAFEAALTDVLSSLK